METAEFQHTIVYHLQCLNSQDNKKKKKKTEREKYGFPECLTDSFVGYQKLGFTCDLVWYEWPSS